MTELVMFAKYWQSGRVKTRLAAAIGQALAARIYYQLLRASLQVWADIADRRTIAFTPRDSESEFAELASRYDWRLSCQSGGDLGQRMQHQMVRGLDAGASAVILVGSDSPTLPPTTLVSGLEFLSKQADAVLSPTDDGGYCLVGARQPISQLFTGIEWGTDTVFATTLARNRQSRCPLRVEILPPHYDVDDLGDLRRLMVELRPYRTGPLGELNEFLMSLGNELGPS